MAMSVGPDGLIVLNPETGIGSRPDAGAGAAVNVVARRPAAIVIPLRLISPRQFNASPIPIVKVGVEGSDNGCQICKIDSLRIVQNLIP